MTEQQECVFYIKRARNIAIQYRFTHDDYLNHTAAYNTYYAQMRQLQEDFLLSSALNSGSNKADSWALWNPRVYTHKAIRRFLAGQENPAPKRVPVYESIDNTITNTNTLSHALGNLRTIRTQSVYYNDQIYPCNIVADAENVGQLLTVTTNGGTTLNEFAVACVDLDNKTTF